MSEIAFPIIASNDRLSPPIAGFDGHSRGIMVMALFRENKLAYPPGKGNDDPIYLVIIHVKILNIISQSSNFDG